MSNSIIDPHDPNYCRTCGGECIADCDRTCPECGEILTDRTTYHGRPAYCDTCDREVSFRNSADPSMETRADLLRAFTLHQRYDDRDVELTVLGYETGETWNGFPVPCLPQWIAYLVECWIDEDRRPPHLIANLEDETLNVIMDGLQWKAGR